MEDFFDLFTDEAAEIASDGLKAFQDAIEKNGLVFTDELKRNFQYHVLRSANQLVIEFDFNEYGRFKDMALLRYAAHMPPVEALEFFVSQIGLDKFAYVYSGSALKQVPTVKNATAKIAWAIAMGRRKVPSVARGYRGTWYNSTKMDIINNAKKRIRWRASEWVAKELRKQLEAEN